MGVIGLALSAASLVYNKRSSGRGIGRNDRKSVVNAEQPLQELENYCVRVLAGALTFEREGISRFYSMSVINSSLSDHQGYYNTLYQSYRRNLWSPAGGRQIQRRRRAAADTITLQPEHNPFVNWAAVESFSDNFVGMLDQLEVVEEAVDAIGQRIRSVDHIQLVSRVQQLDHEVKQLQDIASFLVSSGMEIITAIHDQIVGR